MIGQETKFLAEKLYEAILNEDGKHEFMKNHVFFSKDEIPEDAKNLWIYFDISVDLFFKGHEQFDIYKEYGMNAANRIYEDTRYLDKNDRKEDGRPTIKYKDWYYTFYDDADVEAKYHREIDKFTKKEVEYIRIIIRFTAKIDKGE